MGNTSGHTCLLSKRFLLCNICMSQGSPFVESPCGSESFDPSPSVVPIAFASQHLPRRTVLNQSWQSATFTAKRCLLKHNATPGNSRGHLALEFKKAPVQWHMPAILMSKGFPPFWVELAPGPAIRSHPFACSDVAGQTKLGKSWTTGEPPKTRFTFSRTPRGAPHPAA